MGGALKAVLDPIGSALGAVWDVFNKITEFVGLKKWVIEPLMNFLGFEDEDIYSTDVIAVRIFDDDLYPKTQKDLALQYMAKGLDSIDYITRFSGTGDAQFGRYYRSGKWDYMDYLPTAQINAVGINVDAIKTVLEAKEGDSVFIKDVINMTPTDNDWVKYNLQNSYGYDIGSDGLQYSDGKWYKLKEFSYNTSGNSFSVSIESISVVEVSIFKLTTVTITPIDSTNDNKHEEVITETLSTRTDNGGVIDKVYSTTSDTNTSVPKGSESNSTNRVFISSSIVTIPPTTVNLTIPSHGNVKLYVVKYTTTSNGKYRCWMYDPASGQYPELSSPNSKIIEFDMMPIVTLRNQFFNVTEYYKNAVIVDEDEYARPPSITKERCEDTSKILSSIGIDLQTIIDGYSENPDIEYIQDAFFMIGISPSDFHPIVSITLYEMFDFIYDKLPFISASTAYSAAFKENPYNSAIAWTPSETTILPEKMGLLGDCKHFIAVEINTTTIYAVSNATLLEESTNVGKYGDRKLVQEYTLKEVKSASGAVLSSEIVDATTNEKTEAIVTKEVYDYDNSYPVGETREIISEETKEVTNLILKKQVTLTEVKTLSLLDFTAFSIIRRGVTNGAKALNVADKNLVIPLPVDIVNRLTLLQKTELLGRSAYLTFYSFQHTHLEWYETEDFLKFLKVIVTVILVAVTIVVTVVTWGSMTGPAITATSTLLLLLETVSISVAVQLALKMIVKLVDDPYLKMALSAAVMVVAAAYGGAFSADGAMTALQLTQLAVMSAEIYINDITMKESKLFLGDVSSFNAQLSQRTAQSEDILKGFNTGLTPFDMVDLTTNIDMFSSTGGASNNSNAPSYFLNPSQFYKISTTACYDYDMLYTGLYDNCVHKFVSNSLMLGVGGD